MTRITGILHEDEYTFLIISRSFLLRMRNLSDNVEKCSRAGQATDDNTALAHCMLVPNAKKKHTLSNTGYTKSPQC